MRNLTFHSFRGSQQAQTLTLNQLSADSLVESFSRQVFQPVSLASMVLGGFAFHSTRLLCLQATQNFLRAPVLRLASRAFSSVFALSAEVTTFECSQRSLSSRDGAHFSFIEKSNFAESWRSNFLNFGILKSFGFLFHSQNILLRHLSADFGMIAGHYASGLLSWTPLPQESFLQQLVHAEAMNSSLAMGMLLCHSLLGGRLSKLENSLHIESQTKIRLAEISRLPVMSSVLSIRELPERIHDLFVKLRGRDGPLALDALRSLERILLANQSSGAHFIEIFYELCNPATWVHPEIEVEWMGAPARLIEVMDFRQEGPRVLFEDMKSYDAQQKTDDAAAGIYSALLKNPTLNENDRQFLAGWVDEIWRVEDVDNLDEAQSKALVFCLHALESEHLEPELLDPIIEGALRFAERETQYFLRFPDQADFVHGIIRSPWASRVAQRRFIDIYARALSARDLDLLPGQRLEILEAMEGLAKDPQVADVVQTALNIHIRMRREEAMHLLSAEFGSFGDILNHEALICRLTLRRDLPPHARFRLLNLLYPVISFPYDATYVHVLEFAILNRFNPDFSIADRQALHFIMLKADVDFSHYPLGGVNMKLAVAGRLMNLRGPLRSALRSLDFAERGRLLNFLISFDNSGIDLPMDAMLGRCVSLMRNTAGYRKYLLQRQKALKAIEERRRAQLVFSLLEAN